MSGPGDPSREATAPGKLILLGEYAVLAGGLALVTAVDRVAHCQYTPGSILEVEGVGLGRICPGDGGSGLPFARAVLALGPPPAHGSYQLDTRALGEATPTGWLKLGLGSSAASTVALARAVDPAAPAEALYARAQTAHRQVQGSGSGADVAASAFGGAFGYRWFDAAADAPPGAHRAGAGAGWRQPLPVAGRRLLTAWTGAPASTPALVGQVQAFADRDPQAWAARCADLEAAAAAGVAAWAADDAPGLVSAARAGAEALDALARDSGAPLVLPAHHALAAAAADVGGASKPTGAGGGDLAWLVAPDPAAEAALARAAQALGLLTVRFQVVPG